MRFGKEKKVKELNQNPQTRNEVKRVTGQKTIIPIGQIEQRILLIRGQRVMLDADLAMLYGVPTRVLNQAVRRNLKRFPQDFMFKLTQPEKNQVITICDHLKNLKYAIVLPNAFTEHGAIMAASVLSTEIVLSKSAYLWYGHLSNFGKCCQRIRS